jgi:hypothetical protein
MKHMSRIRKGQYLYLDSYRRTTPPHIGCLSFIAMTLLMVMTSAAMVGVDITNFKFNIKQPQNYGTTHRFGY